MHGLTHRPTPQRLRQPAIFLIPASITLGWLIYVLATSQLDRAIDNWESGATMIFGSFLAGATPAGAGGVAFPVFTKVLDTSAPVARTFSLSIQAIGMTCAAIIILLAHRPIEPRVIAAGIPAGLLGFFAALLLLGEPENTFWPSSLSPAFIKTTFTIVLAAMALMMFMMLRQPDLGGDRIPHWNGRVWGGLILAAFLGGAITAFTGTGVNIVVFLFVVVAGLHPHVGIPTSICIMAAISVAGFIALALLDGQFDIGLNPSGSQVISVDNQPFGPVQSSRYDLLGLWLAAVPIVVWGAPLGTWVVHRLHEDHLVKFIGTLAAVEVISTAVLVDDLHTEPALIAYGIIGLTVALSGIALLRRHRHKILSLPDDLALPG